MLSPFVSRIYWLLKGVPHFLCLCYHLPFHQYISCIQTSYAKGKSDRDFPTSLRCSKARKTSNISSSVWDQIHPGFPIRFGFSGPGCALCPAPDSWPWLNFPQLFSFLRHTYLLRALVYFRHLLWVSAITPMISQHPADELLNPGHIPAWAPYTLTFSMVSMYHPWKLSGNLHLKCLM